MNLWDGRQKTACPWIWGRVEEGPLGDRKGPMSWFEWRWHRVFISKNPLCWNIKISALYKLCILQTLRLLYFTDFVSHFLCPIPPHRGQLPVALRHRWGERFTSLPMTHSWFERKLQFHSSPNTFYFSNNLTLWVAFSDWVCSPQVVSSSDIVVFRLFIINSWQFYTQKLQEGTEKSCCIWHGWGHGALLPLAPHSGPGLFCKLEVSREQGLKINSPVISNSGFVTYSEHFHSYQNIPIHTNIKFTRSLGLFVYLRPSFF
jgi:hypothetical protein